MNEAAADLSTEGESRSSHPGLRVFISYRREDTKGFARALKTELASRYGKDRVNALCARALAFGVLDVPRIERMLRDARRVEDEAVATGRVISLPARFARDASAFATRPPTPSDSEEGGKP